MVLWALAVMGACLMGLAGLTDQDFQEIAVKGKAFTAKQNAESGVALGLNPTIKRDSSLLHSAMPEGRFDVTIKSEQGRLNINTVLWGGQELNVLLRLFSIWGIKDETAHRLTDVLADWVNPAGPKRLNGAEAADYLRMGLPGLPPNRPFPTVDEMEMVPGIEALAQVKPNWKDSFTVFGDGKLDLNDASADLIEAVCGVGSAAAENFVTRRDQSSPPTTYNSISVALAALGLSGEAAQAVEDRVTLNSTYRRISSTGTVGSYRHTLQVVTKIDAVPLQFLLWSE